jgi:Tfp pilus assembly PilM family ATPase
MSNPFKEFFMPKYLVGLEVNPHFIGAVQIFNSLKGPEIHKIAFREVKDHERINEELKEFFLTEDLKRETLITCIPTSRAIIRHIPLPFHNLKKLKKIMKYQMEPHVPDPIHDTIVDFVAPEGGQDIMTFGIPKRYMSEHLEVLSQANLEPGVVSLDNIALFYLYINNHPVESDQPVSIINFGERENVVQIIHGKRLDFIRVLPEGTGHMDDLVDTFNLYLLKKPDPPLGEILLTGQRVNADMAETLSSRTNCEVSLWRPFDKIKHPLGDIEEDLQSKLSVPLGLAISQIPQSSKVFDLRKEEFTLKTTINLKRKLAFTLAGILLLAGLFTFNVYHKVYTKERRYAELKENMRALFIGAFPESKNIIKGREWVQMNQRMEQEAERSRWIEDVTGERRVLDPLLVVSKTISGFPDARIDNLSVEEKKIRMDGQISSFEMVDKLEKSLSGTGFFKDVKLVGAKMDQKGGAVKFNFVMERN